MNKIDTKALREKILDLAMRGKLVPQDPNDESASVLLENIKREKEQLVKDKVIKKQKPLPPIEKEEEPFEIPTSWEWVRLGDVSNVTGPKSISPVDIPEGSWLLELKDVEKNTGNVLSYQYINSELDIKSNKYIFHSGDILFNKLRPYLKKILQTSSEGYCSTEFIPISAYMKKMNKYILAILKSEYVSTLVEQSMYGVNLPRVKPSFLNTVSIPLPPLSEQQRIVSKIEELFAELDKIDKAQETYDNAANKLREKVLDTAMRGKLVPQDPNDEPASELLKRIEDEKQKLIEQKVAPRNKHYELISKDEYPFLIPENWCFTRFGNIANTTKFKSIKPNDIEPGSWILGMGDVEKETGKIINIEYLANNLEIKSNKYLFHKDDILYGKLNPYLKKILVAPDHGVCTTEFIPIKLYGFCSPILYSLILKSPYVSALVDEASYGATLPRVKPDFISRLIVPLPPEQEQIRIVERIELILKVLE